MAGDRLAAILDRLSTDGDAPGTEQLCAVSADVTGTTGAGLMLMFGAAPKGAVCTSDDVSTRLEDLQFTLGEGPCVDAYTQDRPVAEEDLADPAGVRWAAFTSEALATGARAVFGFPLEVGTARLGALNLYRVRPGPLSVDQHADALVMAGVAAQALLVMQSDAPPGALAAELEAGVGFQLVVHQAAGMISAQLGVSVVEALVRLRAHAFRHGHPVREVADDVVGRRLRFDDDSGP